MQIRHSILEYLARRPWLLLDGGLATELERRGADLDDPLWSAKLLLEQPALIRTVHRDYFEAGADVAISATYQASFDAFARRGIDAGGAARLIRNAVALAAAARDEFWSVESNRVGRLPPLIAASVGPYGATLADGSEYRGHYALSDAALMDFHRPRLAVLAQCGADVLACETIPSLGEAIALARLLREFPDACAWISFSCRDGEHTCEGQKIADCVSLLNAFPQIVAVGVNCTAPEFMTPLLREMRAGTDKPLLVYPNLGGHYDTRLRQWSDCSPAARFADAARNWQLEGARLIGGCCRTTPADILAIRAALSEA